MHFGATSSKTVHSEVSVLTHTGFGEHTIVSRKECLCWDAGRTTFSKGFAFGNSFKHSCPDGFSLVPSQTSGAQLVQFYLSCLSAPTPELEMEMQMVEAGVGQEKHGEPPSRPGPVLRKPFWLMPFAPLSVYTWGRSNQVFNETSQCEQGLRKTLSCFATTVPLALLCSTTPSPQDTLPWLLRCPICVGILGTHVLVASYKFLWSKQSGPVSPQKPSSQLAVI